MSDFLHRLRELLAQDDLNWSAVKTEYNAVCFNNWETDLVDGLAIIVECKPPPHVIEQSLKDALQSSGNRSGDCYFLLNECGQTCASVMEIFGGTASNRVFKNFIEILNLHGRNFFRHREVSLRGITFKRLQHIALHRSFGRELIDTKVLCNKEFDDWAVFEAVVNEYGSLGPNQPGELFMHRYMLLMARHRFKCLNIHAELMATHAPHLLAETDSRGETLLSLILNIDPHSRPCRKKDVLELISANPAAVFIADSQGSFPLHKAIWMIRDPDWVFVFNNLVILNHAALMTRSTCYSNHTGFEMVVNQCRGMDSVAISVLETCRKYIPDEVLLVHAQGDSFGHTMYHSALALMSPVFSADPTSWQSRHLQQMLEVLQTREVLLKPALNGRFPLHTLIVRGYEPKILLEHMVVRAPAALERRDPYFKLYPFQLVMMEPYTSYDDELEVEPAVKMLRTIARVGSSFEMLRMTPHLVANALTYESTKYLSDSCYIEAARLDLSAEREYAETNRRLESQRREMVNIYQAKLAKSRGLRRLVTDSPAVESVIFSSIDTFH